MMSLFSICDIRTTVQKKDYMFVMLALEHPVVDVVHLSSGDENGASG